MLESIALVKTRVLLFRRIRKPAVFARISNKTNKARRLLPRGFVERWSGCDCKHKPKWRRPQGLATGLVGSAVNTGSHEACCLIDLPLRIRGGCVRKIRETIHKFSAKHLHLLRLFSRIPFHPDSFVLDSCL